MAQCSNTLKLRVFRTETVTPLPYPLVSRALYGQGPAVDQALKAAAGARSVSKSAA
jgi:hypothetical protein